MLAHTLKYITSSYYVFQIHQEILYIKEVFHNIHSKFIDALDHLQNNLTSMDDWDANLTIQDEVLNNLSKAEMGDHRK